jgi:surface polysaccharide O-acyltransferase-like enzyme
MERRHDLDLVRVGTFFLLIIYHASLVFGTRQFLVKSSASTSAFDIVHMLSHPWRLCLLFFVSGAATAFSLRRQSPNGLRSKRSRQLLIPFLAGMILLIPPQIHAYLTLQEGMTIGLIEVFRRYLTFSPFDFADGSKAVIFSMEHLWYLAYLWFYTAICTTLVSLRSQGLKRIGNWLADRLKGVGLLLWPLAFFVLLRIILLQPDVPHRLQILDECYFHIRYLSCFAAGILLGKRLEFWERLLAVRKAAMIGALACIPILLLTNDAHLPANDAGRGSLQAGLVDDTFMWCTVIAVLGYARHFSPLAHPVLGYLNSAVLSYYVLHQTVMLMLAEMLHALGLLEPASFLALAVLTLIACAVLYEGWRRLRILGLQLQISRSVASDASTSLALNSASEAR